jgi:hypothetical protein
MVRTGTLRERDLVSAGLIEASRLEEIIRVADKFAVGLTTDVAAPIRLATGAGRRYPGSSIAIPTGCC